MFIPGAALAALCYIGPEQQALTIFMLVLAVGFNSAILVGFHVNHIDIAPDHAGTLMGITNALSNVAAILAPLAVDLFKIVGNVEEVTNTIPIMKLLFTVFIYYFSNYFSLCF